MCHGIIDRDPATTKLVPRPAQLLQSPKGRALSVQEVRYLLYTISRDTPIDKRDLAIIYSILKLSLRVSEICKLKVSDIKREGGHWVIDYRSKGAGANASRCRMTSKRSLTNIWNQTESIEATQKPAA